MKLTEQQLTEELKSISYISDIQVINTDEGYVIHSENSKVLVMLDTGEVHSAGRDITFVDGFDIGHVNARDHMRYLRPINRTDSGLMQRWKQSYPKPNNKKAVDGLYGFQLHS